MRKFTIAAGILLTISAHAQDQDTNAIRYAETITAEELKVHLEIIASDEYEGRETGKKGQEMCAAYMSEYFNSIGINGFIDDPYYEIEDSYYQYYPLEVSQLAGTIKVGETSYRFLEDFYFFPGTEMKLFDENSVTFLGYGIDDENYSDYADRDVSGKTIMVLDGEPMNKKGKYYVSGSTGTSSWSSNWRKKSGQARDRNVGVVLVVVEDMDSRLNQFGHYLESPTMKLKKDGEGSDDEANTATIYISKEMANDMLSGWSDVDDLIAQISKKGTPIMGETTNKVVIDTRSQGEDIIASNVLGFIEGTDLKDEVIIITAHYDHIGIKDGEVYNGADDDGSGTVALLELADAFQQAKNDGHGPRRSIVVMGFSGEEKGLLGSSYYTDNPIFPLENTVCNLNIDMIGRIDEAHEGNANYVYLIGSDKLSTELHDISEWANETYMGIELDYTFNDPDDPNRFYYRSDHYNFAKNEVPVIFYFNGVHEDYHQATDTVDKIDYDKIERITQLVFHTAWQLANQDKRIEVNVENDFD